MHCVRLTAISPPGAALVAPSSHVDSPAVDKRQLESLFDLTGRVAIVTGGTRGIGRAVAEGFVSAGAKVVVASRKADACAETEAHLTAMGGDALGIATHAGVLDDLQALVDRTVERFGGVDIVVNNAANALTQPLGEFTPDAWQKSFDVNLRGPVFLVQAALPHLRDSEHAAVVNVISAGAFLFSANVAMYAAAKAGMMSFTRSMAARVRAARDPRERVGTGHDRYRHGACEPSTGAGGDGRREPAPAGGRSRRDGRPGALPRVGRVELHDGPGVARRRRHGAALTPGGVRCVRADLHGSP